MSGTVNDHRVHIHPDRSAPVTVRVEEVSIGVAWVGGRSRPDAPIGAHIRLQHILQNLRGAIAWRSTPLDSLRARTVPKHNEVSTHTNAADVR